ncbi:cupin domain-containing protein [Paenibacillus campi]|uniref:cupin domain-containing protein n=1 Tax=Paenibacillus campi TaxID=3106031 RepID=UPI002B0031BA|nr:MULTISPECIES: cupin domain-containing protein [unclassified Paenibacillus]
MSNASLSNNIGIWELVEPGVRRKVFEPGRAMMMMEVHFEAGSQSSEHSLPYEQMSYCMKGRFEVVIGGQVHQLSAGKALVIPAGVPHSARALAPGILLDSFTPAR